MLQYHSAPALQHDAHVTGASGTTLEVAEAYCQYFNPWTLKFTSWKQQFPGVEHLAHPNVYTRLAPPTVSVYCTIGSIVP